MIIQLAPSAPLLLRAVAGAILVLHISGAATGLAAGTVSLFARKGRRLHRVAGTVFFVAMLAMGGAAAVSAPFIPDRFSAVMGVFVAYLTTTSWLVVQRRPGVVGRLETALAALPVLVAVAYFVLAWMGMSQPNGELDGEPSQVGWIMGGIAVLAALCDRAMIRRGGLIGPHRTARHLWRMTFILAVAWGSFAGQPKAQPTFLKGSPWIALPALIVLAMLFFWLAKTLWPLRRARPAQSVPAVA